MPRSPHITEAVLEAALQGICEEGATSNVKREDKGNNYKFIFKQKMWKDKIPNFNFLPQLQSRHYPILCNQMYARFMDGIKINYQFSLN